MASMADDDEMREVEMGIIHWAKIDTGPQGIIVSASYKLQDVLKDEKQWQRDYPGKRIDHKQIIEANHDHRY